MFKPVVGDPFIVKENVLINIELLDISKPVVVGVVKVTSFVESTKMPKKIKYQIT